MSTEEHSRARPRPDTSKNGRMKKNELQVSNEAVKERGKTVLSRLTKNITRPR